MKAPKFLKSLIVPVLALGMYSCSNSKVIEPDVIKYYDISSSELLADAKKSFTTADSLSKVAEKNYDAERDVVPLSSWKPSADEYIEGLENLLPIFSRYIRGDYYPGQKKKLISNMLNASQLIAKTPLDEIVEVYGKDVKLNIPYVTADTSLNDGIKGTNARIRVEDAYRASNGDIMAEFAVSLNDNSFNYVLTNLSDSNVLIGDLIPDLISKN